MLQYETRAFNTSGVSVTNSSCDSFSCVITLRPEPGTAKYTCEVSSEGPRFAVDRKSTNMTLAGETTSANPELWTSRSYDLHLLEALRFERDVSGSIPGHFGIVWFLPRWCSPSQMLAEVDADFYTNFHLNKVMPNVMIYLDIPTTNRLARRLNRWSIHIYLIFYLFRCLGISRQYDYLEPWIGDHYAQRCGMRHSASDTLYENAPRRWHKLWRNVRPFSTFFIRLRVRRPMPQTSALCVMIPRPRP